MEKHPLHWPTGYTRTKQRVKSLFKVSGNKAQKGLYHELKLLKAFNVIVSSNVHVRPDGYIYSDGLDHKIQDPGVAVYFKWKEKNIVMCCDQYLTVGENLQALNKGIESIRGMQRWGVSDFIERAFTGFTALPEGGVNKIKNRTWYEILECAEDADFNEIKSAYLEKAKTAHPDKGGSSELFLEITRAREDGEQQLRKNL